MSSKAPICIVIQYQLGEKLAGHMYILRLLTGPGKNEFESLKAIHKGLRYVCFAPSLMVVQLIIVLCIL